MNMQIASTFVTPEKYNLIAVVDSNAASIIGKGLLKKIVTVIKIEEVDTSQDVLNDKNMEFWKVRPGSNVEVHEPNN